jgi:hypothetical protein
MSTEPSLFVLVVEDNHEDMRQLERDLPKVINEIALQYDYCNTFDTAFEKVRSRRYDMILSDTYEGKHEPRNAAALKIVEQYRAGRFCPLVLFSSGVMPHGLRTSPFVYWVEKHKIEEAMKEVLDTEIPQLARQLHDELDRAAGSYLWEFLEEHWADLQGLDGRVRERLVRRRASVQLAHVTYDGQSLQSVQEVEGLEFYIYPAMAQEGYCLGDLVSDNSNPDDIGVILTPHCHLVVQPNDDRPRADHVLVARVRPFQEVLTDERGQPWKGDEEKRLDQLRRRTQSPAQIGNPRGRYFFLPGFMDIPDCYCDLMRLTSIPIDVLDKGYTRIATLVSPFAEAIQASLTRFYGAVGVPGIYQESIKKLINTPGP